MWVAYRCLNGKADSLRKPLTLFGRNAGYCAAPMYDAFKAQEMALTAKGYTDVKSIWVPRNCPTGIGGQSCEADGTNCSLHNYGVADDIDPFGHGNPHFYVGWGKMPKDWNRPWNFSDIKLTRAQVEAVEAIRNVQGEQMFRWLGWINGDTMHFEGQVPPSRCEVDWFTVAGYSIDPPLEEEDDMFGLDIGRGDDPVVTDQRVGRLQAFLVRRGYNLGTSGPNGDGVDGRAGPTTRSALNAWKLANGITAKTSGGEGKIGIYEWAAMQGGGGDVDSVARSEAGIALTQASHARATAEGAHTRLDRLHKV